jgi:hypothetical protein
MRALGIACCTRRPARQAPVVIYIIPGVLYESYIHPLTASARCWRCALAKWSCKTW